MSQETVRLYLVSPSVASRTGFASQRYVTKDGKYVVNDRDLRVARMTDEEKAALESVDMETARLLIAENGYKTGNSMTENGHK